MIFIPKDSYYFSHDSNARNDPKILAMRSVYGFNGYGMYWALIEMMREQDGYALEMQGQYVWNALALQLQSEADAVEKFVQCCINDFKLFQSDGEFFWSKSLLKRMENVQVKSEKARQSAHKRWSNNNSNANVMQTQCDGNAIKESKVKESKVKESNIITSEKSATKYIYTDEHLKLANILKYCILENNPNAKVQEIPKIWANEIRLMIDQDNREPTIIEQVIHWSQKDLFWKTNILSVGALRKQFDKLFIKMGGECNATNKTGNRGYGGKVQTVSNKDGTDWDNEPDGWTRER